jgi:hypothetical protein
MASQVLREVNKAKRAARPPSGERDARPVEYLYEAHTFSPECGPEVRQVVEWPIARRTAKRVYFTDGTFVSREELETDTRCRETCPVDTPVTRCAGHRFSYPHCVHVHGFVRKANYEAHWRACPRQCPQDEHTVECRKHGYTWEHCPHGGGGACLHGEPAGHVVKRGRGWWDCADLFATREAAEGYLFAAERKRERERPSREAEVKAARRAMADAHPDRGGTDEEFIAARKRYEHALRRAS